MWDARPTAVRRTDLVYEASASEDLLQPHNEQLQFFRTATGIEDEAQLKAHIVAVQRDAFKVGHLALYCHPECAQYYANTKYRCARIRALRISTSHSMLIT